MAQVRYIVDDVDKAVEFYVSNPDFRLEQQYGPAMAILVKDDLQLWVASPLASASKPMADGSKPAPGGWSRFVLTVDGLADQVSRLRQNGVRFMSEIIDGPAGTQILCRDPSGNVIELFEPAA
jgi:catechol 2,3-dioxygenase-like lactoylglutathione lyase family enzyme